MESLEVMRESVDTTTKQCERRPFLRQLTVLDVGGVQTAVVTDHRNKCLKSFHTTNIKICQSHLQLNDSPWDITKLRDNEIMVTIPDSKQIATVKVNPYLCHMTHINTRESYYSLAVMSPTQLAAGALIRVDILNMQGEVMKSIQTHKNMALFRNTDFMTVSKKGQLLVADWRGNTVTCVTPEGHVSWVYSGSKDGTPRGIATTSGGDILVADFFLRKVIQLSESGEYVQEVLNQKDGLYGPDGICIDKHGALYICEYNELLKFVLLRK